MFAPPVFDNQKNQRTLATNRRAAGFEIPYLTPPSEERCPSPRIGPHNSGDPFSKMEEAGTKASISDGIGLSRKPDSRVYLGSKAVQPMGGSSDLLRLLRFGGKAMRKEHSEQS